MFIKAVRLGGDSDLRYLPNGGPVLNLSVAYDVGFGDKKKTQWLKLAMFGERASKAADLLKKGRQIVAYVDDLHVDVFQGQNGDVHQLKGTLTKFDLVGPAPDQAAGSIYNDDTAGQQATRRPATPPPPPAGADFEDDIPF